MNQMTDLGFNVLCLCIFGVPGVPGCEEMVCESSASDTVIASNFDCCVVQMTGV